MALEITDQLKSQIILTAVQVAGPGANDGQVSSEVSRILYYFGTGSPVENAFARAAKRAEGVVDTKSFPGEVLYVDTENTSNRPIVFLRTEPSNYHPDGIELVRLDRLDSSDSERVKSLANTFMKLVGHSVLLTVAVEKANGKNVRIARGVEDRGAGKPDVANLENRNGWNLIDWSTADRAKIAQNLKRLQGYRAEAQPVAA